MSGLAGIFHLGAPKPVDPARLRSITDAQIHRGPDGTGIWVNPGVGLGHRRLTIIDADTGHQPMATADGGAVISFDGTISNFRELRAQLADKGHQFRTSSDTEVILSAWREWGEGCLPRLDGEFAFALYDRSEDTLILVRDRLGVKPLHFAELSDGSIIFASELKGLLAHPLLRRIPDPVAFEDYLALGYVPDSSCLVAGVRKLAAGHCLRLTRGCIPRSKSWWNISLHSDLDASPPAIEDELIGIMRQAVARHMSANVPVGALLSGSIGSSVVVALMAEASRRAIDTWSIGDEDERVYAEEVAKRFATRHRHGNMGAIDSETFRTIAQAADEPFAEPSFFASYRLCHSARQHLPLVLTGEGPNLVFAGTSGGESSVGASRLGRLARTAFRREPPERRSGTISKRIGEAVHAFRQSMEEIHAARASVSPPWIRDCIYRAGFTRALQGHRGEDAYIEAMRKAPADNLRSKSYYAELKVRLPSEILARMDRVTMSVSLQARHPLLDHRLVELAASLRARSILNRDPTKVLKRALCRHLSQKILNREPPQARISTDIWLSGALADNAAPAGKGTALAELGWFDSAAVARLVTEHRQGKGQHDRLLWQLVMLENALQRLFTLGSSPGYSASKKYSPSGGALYPSAARERA